jgi:hypothetical protein
MTYHELKNWVNALQPEDLDLDVTVYVPREDEYFAVVDVDRTVETDVMDDDHPVLIMGR